jgi:Na+-transporting NADH:ubiquinone oxidoreductase subunit NqrB
VQFLAETLRRRPYSALIEPTILPVETVRPGKMPMSMPWSLFTLRDPRWYQIAGQSIILATGLLHFGFNATPSQIAVAIGTSLTVQFLASHLVSARFDWKSALITGLSVGLLLRANDVWPFALAALLAIGSKFVLRKNNRHLFNPANFVIVLLIGLTDFAWTSTGEWGSEIWFSAAIVLLGALTCWRASRLDAALLYVGVYGAILIARALYLGDPLAIPMLRLSHGAFLLFAFFMISDPKTTPDDPRERAVFIMIAAVIAYVLQYHFFISDGIFYAPFLLALVRAALPARPSAPRYEWGAPPAALAMPRLSARRTAAPAE